MTQFWSVNYICQVCKLKLLFRTCLKFWAIFILIDSYFWPLLNIFYSWSKAVVFGTLLLILSGDRGNFCFWRKYFQSPFIFMLFFYPKTINFHNTEIVSNVLSIGLQYALSFKWLDFCLTCLVTTISKGSSLKFKASVWNFPISETNRNYNSLFKLADNNWVTILEQKRKIEYSWACTFWASWDFSRCRNLYLA